MVEWLTAHPTLLIILAVLLLTAVAGMTHVANRVEACLARLQRQLSRMR